jgi:glucose/arabinose dehydrogenase
MRTPAALALPFLALAACTGGGSDPVETANANAAAPGTPAAAGRPFETEVLGTFDEPWAMAFLPGSNRALISERSGRLMLWTSEGEASAAIPISSGTASSI